MKHKDLQSQSIALQTVIQTVEAEQHKLVSLSTSIGCSCRAFSLSPKRCHMYVSSCLHLEAQILSRLANQLMPAVHRSCSL